MTEQGVGQVALEWNGRSNEDILKDPKVSEEHKRKIRLVEKAKDYFYNYYGFKSNSIYAQTTFLDQEAVSYLVIHSPADKIQAQESCFPIAGCFPYQGFFKKTSALEFKQQKEKEGFQTFMRPVYAYSTLNHPLIPFSDNILSSFFHYKDDQLVHLIFHELVHTIIFVKNEAQFNENLAEFISDHMMVDYLKLEKNYVEKRREHKLIRQRINQKIVSLGKTLNYLYQKGENNSEYTLKKFIRNVFNPEMKKSCQELDLKKCWPLEGEWNNARFAAFATYEAKQDEILALYQQMNLPLKDFVKRIIELTDDFDHDKNIIQFLKEQGKD